MISLVILGVLGGLLALELAVLTKKAGRGLVRQIVKLIPRNERPRWEEEWIRHMEDLQGAPVLSVVWLIGLVVAGVRISTRSHVYYFARALREAKHMFRISRNLSAFRTLDWQAHAMLCPESWRCTDGHHVKARRNFTYWRAILSVLWWAAATVLVVFRPSVGIDRAVGQLMRIPEVLDAQITPVERR